MSEIPISGSLGASSSLSVAASRQRSISGSLEALGSPSAAAHCQRLIKGSIEAASHLYAGAIQTCWYFMTDAAMEKCLRHPFLVDTVLVVSGKASEAYPTFNRAPKVWNNQYAEPNRRLAF